LKTDRSSVELNSAVPGTLSVQYGVKLCSTRYLIGPVWS